MAVPAVAQKKDNLVKQEAVPTVEQLIWNYDFDRAVEVLQRDINSARKAGKSTDLLEADLLRANLGADMLRGTERIVFVDSFKVARSAVLETVHFTSESGKWVPANTATASLNMNVKTIGRTAYINELNDRMIFSKSDSINGPKHFFSAYRLGQKWGIPQPLEGMTGEWTDCDNPFVMPDGVTLYFAAQGNESLGGYDLFVTRYNTESKQFLKAENMGMPFNSPANDYMLAIDETANLGWLVSDRFQSPDSVCVYVFVPSESREIYELTEATREHVINMARLASIADTQYDKQAVTAAKQRMIEVFNHAKIGKSSNHGFYVIDDKTVYTTLNDFRSDAARRIAEQCDMTKQQIDELLEKRDALQRIAAQGKRLTEVRNQLKQINQVLPELHERYRTLCKNMRKAEK